MVVGVEDEIGVLESGHRGETFFRTLQYKDNQIFRRYYLGNLLLGDNSQTGTYAQSQTQLEFGSLVFDGILEEIANCIQKQIINPIVEANFKDINLSPTFSFDKFTTGDIQGLLTTLKPLMDSGIIDAENETIHDSIAMLIKKETGLNYTNETEPITEDFNIPPNREDLTTNIIDQLEV
jgi:phage gp29-like protein